MLALEKWGEGRSPLLLEMSQVAALNAESVFELCTLGRGPEFRQRVARFEDNRRWISNYRRQSHVFFPTPAFASEFLARSKKDRAAVGETLELLRSWLSLSPRQRLLNAEKFERALRKEKPNVTWDDFLAELR